MGFGDTRKRLLALALSLALAVPLVAQRAASEGGESGGAAPVARASAGPGIVAQGHLLAVGGGMRDPAILRRFIALAGGPDAPIVIIPTAGADKNYQQNWHGTRALRAAGATNLIVLHTRDRREADSAEFVAPLLRAGGVFIAGGRQTRLAEAYLDTRTHRELFAVLERGGVVAGSSAGASILASFLMRGDTRSNQVVVGEYARGFGLLPHSAIDQHVLKRNRQFDLVPVIAARPELLGIGLDEDTAIVISGDEFEVLGQSYVLIHDARREAEEDDRDLGDASNDLHAPPFYFLAPGDRFNLRTREALRQGRSFNPLPRAEVADSQPSP